MSQCQKKHSPQPNCRNSLSLHTNVSQLISATNHNITVHFHHNLCHNPQSTTMLHNSLASQTKISQRTITTITMHHFLTTKIHNKFISQMVSEHTTISKTVFQDKRRSHISLSRQTTIPRLHACNLQFLEETWH